MAGMASATVVDKKGLRGQIERRVERSTEGRSQVLLKMENGQQVWVSDEWLELQDEGSYFLPIDVRQLPAAQAEEGAVVVVPILAEELRVGREAVITGGLRITKNVVEEEKVVREPRTKETLQVERVPINREVSEPPTVRQEGEVLIVPLVEEIAVVEKRLVLREEVRITRQRETVEEPQRVMLRREEAHIERTEAKDS